MFKLATMLYTRSKIKRQILAGCLLALFGLVLPAAALAGPPAPLGAEKCAECHEVETELWQDTPHAQAYSLNDQSPGAACRDCHGTYIIDHAEAAGMMKLDIDSSICEDCHAGTFEQWENSSHAQTGVQCIGCHLSHSQEFRLTDEALCGACHRDQLGTFAHTTHSKTDITCASCHLASVPVYETTTLVSTIGDSEEVPAPTHDFATVSSHTCMECHNVMTLHEESPLIDIEQVTNSQLHSAADRISELTADLETTRQTNNLLQKLLLVSLGLGLWLGAILGIVLILAIGYIKQARTKK
jgi:hypothetical protein